MLRVVFAGTPLFALPSLQALVASSHDVTLVLTQPDRPSGRGRRVTPSVVKTYALEQQLPVYQPERLRRALVQETLQAVACDVMVVVAYGLMIPKWLLRWPRYGCINVHPSLLPRWRGAAPIPHTLLAGDQHTGVCVIQLTEALDAGDILGQVNEDVQPTDNSQTLHDRLAQRGAALLVSVLDQLEAGTCRPAPQSPEGITYASKLVKTDARLDWTQPAEQLWHAVRAYHPWPVAYTHYQGEPLKIWAATVVPCDSSKLNKLNKPNQSNELNESDEPNEWDKPNESEAHGPSVPPGTILAAGSNGLVVKAGRDALCLLEVQRPGRRRCTASAFVNAEQQRLQVGKTRLI